MESPINKILTSDVISVSAETPLPEAIKLMKMNRISCLVVNDHEKPVGIFTERDLVKAIYQKSNLDNLIIKELMSRKVITAPSDISMYDAINIFGTHNIRHLIITDTEGKLTGIVTLTDIRNNLGFEYFVEIKQISKIMSKNVVTSKRKSYVSDTIAKMAKYSISCIVIEDNQYPVGILTERDIVSFFGQGEDVKSITNEEVMTPNVLTVPPDAPVHEAFTLMDERDIRRLVVVDGEGRIAGLITQSDIIRRLERRYIEFLKDSIQKKEEALQETKKLLSEQIVLDNIMSTSMDMAIIASDLELHIIYFNPSAENIYGLSAAKAIGTTTRELFEKETGGLSYLEEALERAREGEENKFTIEQKKNGGFTYIETRVAGIWDKEGQLNGFVFMSQDITERKMAEETLRSSEEKYRSLVESTEDSIYLIDRNYRYLFVNQKHLERIGLSEEQILGKEYSSFHSPDETRWFVEKVNKIIKTGESLQHEHRSLKDGRYFFLTMSPVKVNDEGIMAVTVISKDVTEFKLMEEELHKLSMTDELSGLYNRRGFFTLADQQLKIAKRTNRRMTLLSIDMDNLKGINDTLGHKVGDIAILQTAHILRESFRESDIIARIGGDEFVVLQVEITDTQPDTMVSRLQRNIEDYNAKIDGVYELSLSMGAAHFDHENPKGIEDLLVEADKFMYEHKKSKLHS
jgi:diguanylate cyclase (GGDEF)-like protein/PAS domain S-box-containing protein